MKLREARDRHFARGGFSEAQYAARWAQFRLGRFFIWVPNTRGRTRALPYHDLHHVLTEYQTTWRGEAEIAAWELASGCRSYATAWLINVAAAALGMLLAPRSVCRAFRHGRRCRNLYGQPIDELMDQPVGDVRARLGLHPDAGAGATL